MNIDTIIRKADRKGLLILAFFIIGIAAYANTLHVPFYLDDTPNITGNPHIRIESPTLTALLDAGWKSLLHNRPVANISFALNYYFHHYDLFGYHAVNILIHILAGVLLFRFILLTLNTPALLNRYPHQTTLAFLAALLWFIHPVQTQSVTYTVQRMNSMAAMFYILAFICYVKGRFAGATAKRWTWFAGGFRTTPLVLSCSGRAIRRPRRPASGRP